MNTKQIRQYILAHGYRSTIDQLIHEGYDSATAHNIVREQHDLCAQYHVSPDGTIKEIDE